MHLMDDFEKAHETFIAKHISLREGARLRRLEEGHGHAEKKFLQQIWWHSFGHFQDLHPEYEIKDFRDGSRFLDFAFLRHSLKLAIEIDGYVPHSSDISRAQFSDQLVRQNHLILDGWKVLRFSYDDVKNRPRMCEQALQQCIGRHFGDIFSQAMALNYIEKEIIRFALTLEREIKPTDVQILLQIGIKKAQRTLKEMYEKSLLEPGGEGRSRIRCYKVNPHVMVSWARVERSS